MSDRLVLTPQLQLAIELLSTPSNQLSAEAWLTEIPGLSVLPDDQPDPLDLAEQARIDAGELDDPPPWCPANESTLPAITAVPDVWVTGNPPVARANRHAYPRLAGSTKDALWLVRALRQRARTYEKVIQAIVDRRPLLGTTPDPAAISPVPIRELCEHIGLHESTIERVARVVQFQNLQGLVGLTLQGRRLGFAAR